MRFLAVTAAAGCLLAGTQEGDRLHVNEVPEEFRKRWTLAEEKADAKEQLDLYALAHEKFPSHLVRPDPEVARWIPLPRQLAARLAALPSKARDAHEAVARQVFLTVLEPEGRRKAIEKYAYTRAGCDALELMANADSDEGRLNEALRGWSRAFETRPTPEIVARLALAHALRGDTPALAALKTHAEALGLKGEIAVAGRPRDVYEYLDSLMPGPLLKPVDARIRPAPEGPTNEIRLGRHEFPYGEIFGRGMATGIPAVARTGDRELAVFTNGMKVIAVDSALAEGSGLEDATAWRFPRDGSIRSWGSMPNAYPWAQPNVGIAVAGGRAFVTMFTRETEKHQQVGRRPDRLEGPAALRALDLATGELLWDSETVETEVRGEKVRVLETLPYGKCNFSFGGPPVVRGDRVYAAVMTSPLVSPRQCWAVCLDARTGLPLWCTEVASTPPIRNVTSVVSFAEHEGTLVLLTNFGAVAALDSITGAFEWLVKYPATPAPTRKAASPPVIAGSLVYVFPQDADEMLVYDRWTGREAPLLRVSQEIPWTDVARLLGRVGGWLVFSGAKNFALRVHDGQVVPLFDAEREQPGRGAIVGTRVYLPTRATLHVYDAMTWKLVSAVPWSEEAGNVAATESLLLFQGDAITLYASPGGLLERFRPRVEADAARPEACRRLAVLLEGSGRLKEAVPYYRRALGIWEKDPASQETSDGLRKKLEDLKSRLQDDFPEE